MSSKTFPLRYPAEHGGVSVSEVTLRRPKGRDIRRLASGKGTNVDVSFNMIANLAEVDPGVVDDIDAEDLADINAWLEPLLDPKARPDASTS